LTRNETLHIKCMRKSSRLFDKKLNLSHKMYEEICKMLEK
jgi:hypothetical protein